MRRVGSATICLASVAAVCSALAACPAIAAAHGGMPFRAGAASVNFTPPAAGKLANDPADCAAPPTYSGRRDFAFEEPYEDQQGSGHYDPGDPYIDCNGNGRWDGNLLGGGAGSPRFYDHVADQVGARAMVVSNGQRRVAVEVLDNEGAFNVYLQRIRQRVAADGVHLERKRLLRGLHGEAVSPGDRTGGPQHAAGEAALRRATGAGQSPAMLVVVPLRRRP